MSLLFTGYYGRLNTGDDVFGVICDWGARKYWGHEDLRFFGRNLPQRLDGSELKSGFRLRKKIKGQELLETMALGFGNSKIIYAGGSIFHSEVRGLSKNALLKAYQALGVIELGAIGVSLGPFKNDEAKSSIKQYLSKFSFLALRDRRSYDIAMNMKLSIPIVESFDLAGLLPYIYPVVKKENSNPVLGISLCNYERYVNNGDLGNEKRRFDKIVGTIKLLIKIIPNIELKIFVFNAHPIIGDHDISNALMLNIGSSIAIEKVAYSSNPNDMWNAVSSCDAVLATRLHAGVFACFSRTPYLQVEYHPKCSDFLEDINYPKDFRIGDMNLSEEEVCSRLVQLLELKTPLIDNIERLQEKASLNFTKFSNQF